MKKTLLLVAILFVSLSLQALADAFGCGTTIPIEVCKNPGGTQNSQPVKNLPAKTDTYGALAFDINPSNIHSVSVGIGNRQKSLNDAIQESLSDCGHDSCRVFAQYKNSCGAISANSKFENSKSENYIYGATGKTLTEATTNAYNKCTKSAKSGEICAIMLKACSID